MKKLCYLGFMAVLMFAIAGCAGKQGSDKVGADSLNVSTVADSALYGTVGEGTSMHSLEVMDENGKTQTYLMDEESEADIQGGIFSGDKITFTAVKTAEGEMQISKLINLTSLCGKWTSLDRNFTINEDGTVESHQPGEIKPYTQWSMVNCKIVFNVDTFAINLLGPDSLELENSNGIFVYKRVKK